MWQHIAASVAGTSHARNGAPCQDACRVQAIRQGGRHYLVMVCSDGAGSASLSEMTVTISELEIHGEVLPRDESQRANEK